MNKLILAFIFTLTLYASALAQSNFTDDTFVITTYYPAPYGVYRNMRLQPSDLPTNGVGPGVMYYNQTEDMMKFYNGSIWLNMTGGGGGGYWTQSGTDIRNTNTGGNVNVTDVCTTGGVCLSAGGSGVPSGVILMYSGAWNFNANGLGTGALAGWALCNGNNGTPNLTDRFVTSASASTELGLTGGANSYSLTVNQMPSHTHNFTTGAAGTHDHGASATYSGQFGLQCGGCIVDQRAVSIVTTSAGNHTHAGTTDGNGAGAVIENRPAFLRLAFIMKL